MQYPSLPTQKLTEQFKQKALALTESIARKDLGTAHHSERTAQYALKIARHLPNMTEAQLEFVRWAAILHDIGKIQVEDSILLKTSALEPAEKKSMRQHPWLGFRILNRLLGSCLSTCEGALDVLDGTLYHHERWDGAGYPFGLMGASIPWVARLIAVADAYDAMVSTRPYRDGMSPQAAYDEIVSHGGTQFDPIMVQAFARAFGEFARPRLEPALKSG